MTTQLETREDGLYIDGKKVLKGWESFSGWYWFGVEIDHTQDSIIPATRFKPEHVQKDDPIWYGFVQGLENEWGYFSQGEIESLGAYKAWPIKTVGLPHAGRREHRRYTPQVKS